MIARLRTWWQGRTLRRLRRAAIRHADAALKAHARGDKAAYVQHADAARTASNTARQLEGAADWTLQTR